jgi:hypothetical protein
VLDVAEVSEYETEAEAEAAGWEVVE